jgi:TRAP-type C4-dicarboxylate transport system substrate-binding protein
MRRREWRGGLACLAVAALGVGAGPVEAQTRVKLATMAPDGSAWHKALMEMGSEWRKLPDGGVELRVYPGGTAGDEAAVVRKMRISQLDAAAITIVGLVEIDESFEALGIPLLFDSYAELSRVLEELRPYFEQRLEAKGFVLVNWAHGGWAHLFSALEIRSIEDLKKAKIFVSAGDDVRVQWWKDNGFNPRALAATDVLTGLQTGMIDTMVSTPLIAMSMQWYKRIPFMHHLPLGPVVGANVLARSTWDRLTDGQRAGVLAAGARAEEEILRRISADDQAAIELMKERGLEVVQSDDEAAWRRELARFATQMRGEMVPAEAYDLMIRTRDRVRAALGGGATSGAGGSGAP